MKLNAYHLWMVEKNVEHARENGDGDTVVATLRANGYPSIADAVEAELRGEQT